MRKKKKKETKLLQLTQLNAINVCMFVCYYTERCDRVGCTMPFHTFKYTQTEFCLEDYCIALRKGHVSFIWNPTYYTAICHMTIISHNHIYIKYKYKYIVYKVYTRKWQLHFIYLIQEKLESQYLFFIYLFCGNVGRRKSGEIWRFFFFLLLIFT